MNYYNRSIFILISLFIVLQSCKFDLFEENEFVIPTVNILDIEVQQDTVFIIVDIIDNGNPIEVIGIAYEQGKTPEITDNQQFYGATSGTFSIPVLRLEGGIDYTFVAFAGNEYSIGYSEPTSFTTPDNLGFRALCELTSNELDINGIKYSAWKGGSANYALSEFRISPNGRDFKMDLWFAEPPRKGIYTTCTDGSQEGNGKVSIYLTIDNYQSIIRSGGSVYVDTQGSDNYVISFCDLIWKSRNGEVKVTGLFEI